MLINFGMYESLLMFINNYSNHPLILFGAGEFGRKASLYLLTRNVRIDYFCDNDCQKWHQQIYGIEVISIEEFYKMDRNTNIIITSSYYDQIFSQLVKKGFKNIYYWPFTFYQNITVLDEIYSIINKLNQKIHSFMFSPINRLRINAMNETAEYIKNNMQSALLIEGDYDGNDFRNTLRFLGYALNMVKLNGLFLEFGVYQGTTINYIAKSKPNEIIYGFDSFKGLPEVWNGFVFPEGTFKTEMPQVEKNVKLIPGWFDETLPKFIQEHNSDNVAFLHIDCDIYSSTATIFRYLADKIVKGTIIVFDEYYNYPNWQNHEYKAFKEFVEKYGISYRYIAAGYQQVAVIIE